MGRGSAASVRTTTWSLLVVYNLHRESLLFACCLQFVERKFTVCVLFTICRVKIYSLHVASEQNIIIEKRASCYIYVVGMRITHSNGMQLYIVINITNKLMNAIEPVEGV